MHTVPVLALVSSATVSLVAASQSCAASPYLLIFLGTAPMLVLTILGLIISVRSNHLAAKALLDAAREVKANSK